MCYSNIVFLMNVYVVLDYVILKFILYYLTVSPGFLILFSQY